MVDYSISSLRTFIFAGTSVCDDPGLYKKKSYNIDCGCSLEPPRRGGSNEYPQSVF